MKFGFGKTCINPSLPVRLSGYGKERIATEIHDDLFAKVILFEDKDGITGIVTLDLIGIDEALKTCLRSKLVDIQLSLNNLVVYCTHTHSGPVGTLNSGEPLFQQLTQTFGEINYEYINFVANCIVSACSSAKESLQFGRVQLAKTKLSTIGKERHDASFTSDEDVFIMEFVGSDETKVLLYQLSCHPTVMSMDNIMITKDLPYGVEKQNDQYDMIFFINGSCGDISTRFTRKESSFQQIEEYGKEIYNAIQIALQTPFYSGLLTKCSLKKDRITMNVKQIDSIDVALQKVEDCNNRLEQAKLNNQSSLELRMVTALLEGAQANLMLSKSLAEIKTIDVEYSIWKWNDIKIANIPGELFSSVATILKDKGYLVFGYADQYYLYLADERAYDNAFYEALSSPFAKGETEAYLNEILRRE